MKRQQSEHEAAGCETAGKVLLLVSLAAMFSFYESDVMYSTHAPEAYFTSAGYFTNPVRNLFVKRARKMKGTAQGGNDVADCVG